MIIVHHLGISQSDRIVWLCEELEIPYQLIRYERDPRTHLAPAAYKALHPMGIAPVITDGDLVLAESGAIMEYLMAKYAGGRLSIASNQPNFADYLFWFHFANGSMMPSELMRMLPSMFNITDKNATINSLGVRSDKAYDMMEKRLGETMYLAGNDFSAADIMMVFTLTTLRGFAPRDLVSFPHIRAYLKRIGGRPAYQRAMAKADPGVPLNLE